MSSNVKPKGEMIGWGKLTPAQRLKARRKAGAKTTAKLTKAQLRERALKGVKARWGTREDRRARARAAKGKGKAAAQDALAGS